MTRRPRIGLAALAAASLIACGACFGADAGDPAWSYNAERGDTLIGLGQRLLADPKAWPEVARASGLRDPNRIAVGTPLKIPLRLLRSEAAQASLVSLSGAVRARGNDLRAGELLAEGSALAAAGPSSRLLLARIAGAGATCALAECEP